MAQNGALGKKGKESTIDYTQIVQSQKFQNLLRQKRNFILPLSIFFFVFYFTLPVLTAYSTVLNQEAFLHMSWAWVFAFAEFVMTWTLCTLYTKKARSFDKIATEIKQEIKG
ncbi:DUF485 domain-containing protein [Peribacillus asahii]|uniref:DUF485 domain-containing protein n=1 Tax=Peribacillus asahii TaxID=228899 RepID=A0A398B2A8_9BACI|nr:DUF485 domain-containing protein [Peribacillus asahii]RID82080.1 DUF485 domain-containing protein [Peribacillus asahii]